MYFEPILLLDIGRLYETHCWKVYFVIVLIQNQFDGTHSNVLVSSHIFASNRHAVLCTTDSASFSKFFLYVFFE